MSNSLRSLEVNLVRPFPSSLYSCLSNTHKCEHIVMYSLLSYLLNTPFYHCLCACADVVCAAFLECNVLYSTGYLWCAQFLVIEKLSYFQRLNIKSQRLWHIVPAPLGVRYMHQWLATCLPTFLSSLIPWLYSWTFTFFVVFYFCFMLSLSLLNRHMMSTRAVFPGVVFLICFPGTCTGHF